METPMSPEKHYDILFRKVSHIVDDYQHLDLGRWTKGEYGPGDVYSAEYLLERHHYRRPDLVEKLQNGLKPKVPPGQRLHEGFPKLLQSGTPAGIL